MFSLCGGCISGESKTQNQKIYYFNLKNFFEAEVLRLNIENPAVYKSVYHNKQSQKKKVEINDWATELSLFTESDINKTAFKNSYHTDSAATKIVYTAKNKDLKTQRITIYLQNYKPVYVHIINYQKNYLFKSLENLIYYTKKAYVIKKKQKPLFGDTETYNVKGIF
ncbi:MAG: hypothetical protein EAZ15_02670 [Sphingobacteriales bacterium]|nr:MAG: hypothetical protein EAZ15_02670 [Sphingobacteriales bacterium]